MAGKKKKMAAGAAWDKNEPAGDGYSKKGSRSKKERHKRPAHKPENADAASGHRVQKPGSMARNIALRENNAADEEKDGKRDGAGADSGNVRRRSVKAEERLRGRGHNGSERTKKSASRQDFKEKGSAFTEGAEAEFKGSRKLERLQNQAEKAGEKARKARAKLPKAREYTLRRVFDEKTGRAGYVLSVSEKEKLFKPEGLHKSAVRRMRRVSRNFVHGKITEAEKENSAVEGAHKAEQKSEELFGFIRRQANGKGQRLRAEAAKLEKRQFQKEVSFRYQKFLEENPQMKKKALRKRIQKQRIKREYIKARKNAAASKAAEQALEKTKNGTTIIARKIQELAGKNAGLLAAGGIMLLLIMMIMVSVSSCGAMFADMQSTILASAYLSRPEEIDAAEQQLTRLEFELQDRIDRVETDYPGYDEYSYNLGAVGHNPFTLISYLSAVHTEFTAAGVESEVQALFDGSYTLTLTPDTETRTRTVTDPATGDEIEEEYEVRILRVELEVIPLESLAAGRMNAEQAEIFAMYQATGGLLQAFASPLGMDWHPLVSSYYGYRKNPVTGSGEIHRGVDIAVPEGTAVYAAHDGTVTAASYDAGYGNYAVIEKDGYVTKYAHMESLNVGAGQAVIKGDAIGAAGNTGSSTGSHLHIECLYNGEYYNPIFYFNSGGAP